jgi:5-methylcytosine-specific restriction endonuclease McrA
MIPEYKTCPLCKTEKHKSEYHIRRDKGYEYLKSYCKSCAASDRFLKDKCECGQIKMKKSTYCQSCSVDTRVKYHTMADIRHYGTKYGQSASFNIIRGRARNSVEISSCQNCGYSKHVEVCHIKPIHSFSDDTLIDDINRLDNLLFLCPNCHWEFDRGLLEMNPDGNDPSSQD